MYNPHAYRHGQRKEGYGILATAAKSAGMKLFRLRPKIHLSQHQALDLLKGSHRAVNTMCPLLAITQRDGALAALCRLHLRLRSMVGRGLYRPRVQTCTHMWTAKINSQVPREAFGALQRAAEVSPAGEKSSVRCAAVEGRLPVHHHQSREGINRAS